MLTEVVDVALFKQFKSTDTKEFSVLTHPCQTWVSKRRWLKRSIFNRLFINAKSWCLGMTGPCLLSDFAHHNPTFTGASTLGLGMGIQVKKGGLWRKRQATWQDVLCSKMHPEPTLPNHLRPSCHPLHLPFASRLNIPSISHSSLRIQVVIVTSSHLLCDNTMTTHMLTWTPNPSLPSWSFLLRNTCVGIPRWSKG